MSGKDPFHLERFVRAQEPVYQQVCTELRSGLKTGHWMWFIFPQIAGLGYSSMARMYAISSIEEAAAYLRYPVLGPRLRECCELLNALEGRTAAEIFGYPDTWKLRSSLTLFARAAQDNQVFRDALEKYFGGEEDNSTLERL